MTDRPIEYTTLRVDELQYHPLQHLYYPPETATDDHALRADIEAHGLREPVVVLPPNEQAGLIGWTIADGHRRVEVCRQLGWETIDVTIRHDLADADAETVEQEFLSYNYTRRQLHVLDQARVALRLYQIEAGRSRDDLRPHEEPEARDRVAKRLNMTGRNLSRYWRVLRCPKPVQDAVRDGRLHLALAERIEVLGESAQQRLAERIAQETDPRRIKAIVTASLPRGIHDRGKPLWTAVRRLARELDRALSMFDGKAESLADFALVEHADVFARGRDMLTVLAEKATNPARTRDEVYGEMVEKMRGDDADDESDDESDDADDKEPNR